MPAFSPLAINHEKTRPELTSLWAPEEEPTTPPKGHSSRKCITTIFNSVSAQYAKLVVLCILAVVHLYYMNDYIEKFAVFEELTNQVEVSVPRTEGTHNDSHAILYTMRALIDYKKNLWMTVGAMCACLASTASILMVSTSPKPILSQTTFIAIRFFDIISFVFIAFLLLARISIAITITHMVPHALRSADRLVTINEVVNQLSCTLEAREMLPLCSQLIIGSIFPVKVIEYLIILCILTGAYIGLAYLIQWCIRHFFPPTHHRMNPIIAISRNISPISKSSGLLNENILVQS